MTARWRFFGMAGLGLTVGLSWWLSRSEPSDRSKAAVAAFTRPLKVSAGLDGLVEVSISGQDWWVTEPVVTTGEEVVVNVNWKGPKQRGTANLVHIYPRPESSPEFDFYDHRVDLRITARNGKKKYPIRMKPGKYVVRFYLETLEFDSQNEPLPRVNLIAERPLTVRPGSGAQIGGILPGDDPMSRRPFVIAEYGPGLE